MKKSVEMGLIMVCLIVMMAILLMEMVVIDTVSKNLDSLVLEAVQKSPMFASG